MDTRSGIANGPCFHELFGCSLEAYSKGVSTVISTVRQLAVIHWIPNGIVLRVRYIEPV
ncbi:MAG: hypothetical protein IPH49_14130 [Ignavibacteria bacterium]|nr:hypothetical protein [Ignavibacteria bacterium]